MSEPGRRQSAIPRAELEQRLAEVGRQDDATIDLAETALVLAALDRPRVGLSRYSHHLSLLARDVADVGAKAGAAQSLSARIATLAEVIAGRYHYAGDRLTYDDLQNANMMRVIDRRKGLPVALGILFLHAARSQGWEAEGLDFPGHFLVRLTLGGTRAILDPFEGGAERNPAELRQLVKAVMGSEAEPQPRHFAPLGSRGVLLRLQNNIKLRLVQEERSAEALTVVETMLRFAPAEVPLWREAGILQAHLGKLKAARESLERYLEASGERQGRSEVLTLLQQVKSRLN